MMSSIYFFTQNDGKAEVHGSEKSRFRNLILDLFVSSLAISYPMESHPLYTYIPTWVTNDRLAKEYFCAGLYQEIAGLDALDMQLNTAISLGNEAIKLAACVYACSETNGYFTPCDFDWLKQSIALGMEMGLYGKQWEDVIALTDRATGPIVMGRDRFPMRTEDNWDDAFAEIKDVQRIFPPINPVGHGLNGWQLIRRLIAKKECTSV